MPAVSNEKLDIFKLVHHAMKQTDENFIIHRQQEPTAADYMESFVDVFNTMLSTKEDIEVPSDISGLDSIPV